MGQFQNQPDFATKAEEVTSLPYTPESPSAIYIGEKTDTAADASITVIMPGRYRSGTFITFKNVTTGFLTGSSCNCTFFYKHKPKQYRTG